MARNISYNLAYSRTFNGMVARMYADQRKATKQRGHACIAYTKNDLSNWIVKQSSFTKLWDDWVKSGYNRKMKPSCDRIDDYIGYTLNNLRLVAFHVNESRYYHDSINGINTKNCKAVISTDDNGNEVEYYSMSQAHRATKALISHISSCCSGERNTAGGFSWRLKG